MDAQSDQDKNRTIPSRRGGRADVVSANVVFARAHERILKSVHSISLVPSVAVSTRACERLIRLPA